MRGRLAQRMLLVGCAFLPGTAFAQQADPSAPAAADAASTDAETYPPEFFTAFAPRTALDMVDRLPGFTIDFVNNGGDRGLGSARENILINGERIASKSLDARTVLSRITAANVVRIEIADGSSLDVPGLTGRVANIITRETGFTRTIRWEPNFRKRMDVNFLNGEISTTGTTKLGQITLSLSNDQGRSGHWGPEVVRGRNDELLFVRDEIARYNVDSPKLSGALARKAVNGNLLNLNGQLQYYRYRQRNLSESEQAVFGTVVERFRADEREWNGEFGADYEFGLGGGKLKLIGLYSFETSPTVNSFIIERDSSGTSGDRFRQTADESESILRGEYRWQTAGGSDWQLSLEGAYNTLGVVSALDVLQADGSFLPAGSVEDTKVDEKRADFIITHGRKLADNLTLQANIGGEYSELSQTGPNGLTRRFVRPKGKLALSWKASERFTLNYEIQRRVDQLDFFDFASSVDIVGGQNNQGNTQLVPPQVWRTQIESVLDLKQHGNLTLQAAYARADDIVDQIPLSPTTEGRGNLPRAHLYRVTAKGTWLLGPIGWDGARFDFNLSLRRNRVRDPLSGQWRNLTFSQDHIVDMSLRYDVPNSPWATGVSLYDENISPGVRLNEIIEQTVSAPNVAAFVEHKDVAGLTLRAQVRNILGVKEQLSRVIYQNRRDGPVALSEFRQREFGPVLQLSLTGQI